MPEPRPWPFPALAPLDETREWLTEVLTTREGEQRITLRTAARETLTLQSRLDDAGLAEAVERVRAGALEPWLVPLWHEAAAEAVTVSAGALALDVDTADGPWRAPGWAALATEAGVVATVEVAAVEPDRLVLAAPAPVSLPRAIVVPARRAMLAGALAIERRRGRLAEVAARFRLLDSLDDPDTAYPSHEGLDVLTDPAVLRRPLEESLARAVETVDAGFGPMVLEPVSTLAQRRQTLVFVDRGPAARRARRRWLDFRRGRQRAFWLPGWGRELRLLADLAPDAAALRVAAPAEPADPAALVGRCLMAETPAGLRLRRVETAARDGDALVLGVAPLGVAAPAATPLSWTTRVRLDADRAEIAHHGLRSELALPVLEVPA
jgi:hypothetical protein